MRLLGPGRLSLRIQEENREPIPILQGTRGRFSSSHLPYAPTHALLRRLLVYQSIQRIGARSDSQRNSPVFPRVPRAPGAVSGPECQCPVVGLVEAHVFPRSARTQCCTAKPHRWPGPLSRAESQGRRASATAFHTATVTYTRALPNPFVPLAPFLPFSAPPRLCASPVLQWIPGMGFRGRSPHLGDSAKEIRTISAEFPGPYPSISRWLTAF